MPTQGRSVHSVEKAIALLDCFWHAGGSLSLTELVQKTGWAKSTVHGLLASMLDSAVVGTGAEDRLGQEHRSRIAGLYAGFCCGGTG